MKQLNYCISRIETTKLTIRIRFLKMLFSKIRTIIFLLLSVFAFNSAHANEKDAANFVNDTANRVIEIVKRTDLEEGMKEARLNEIFQKVVDTRWIGKFSIGQYWRTLSSDQQNEFLDLYTKYLTGMYVPNFKKYTGNVVKVTSAKELRPNEFFVQTVIVNPVDTRGNIQVNYMLRQDSQKLESFVIFDIIAEGVSLITTQRAELSSVMGSKGFDEVINSLKKRTDN
jgi:phospholipid transport system substrate-binding protein